MRLFNFQSIKGKLNLLMAVSSGLALLISCVVFVANDTSMLRASKVKQLTALAEVLASNSTAALSFDQATAADNLLASLIQLETIAQAALFDSEGEYFAGYQRADCTTTPHLKANNYTHEFTKEGFLDITVPVLEEGEYIGALYIHADMSDLRHQTLVLIVVAVTVMGLSLFVALVLASRLQKFIAGPIVDLAATTQRITDLGDYSLRVTPKSHDEIGVLYERFNLMLDRIQDGEMQLREAHNQLEARVEERTQQLSAANDQLKQQMEEREVMNRRMIELSHQAGKAEVATGVLHNVGNVLNSINVSASLVEETLRQSRLPTLKKTADLIGEQDDLGSFMTTDPRGQMVPGYLTKLADSLLEERDLESQELRSLIEHLDHVKTIVSMQQSYAGVSGLLEPVMLPKLLDEAELLNASSLVRHAVEIVREIEPLPELLVEKQKVMQILVNLLKNAKDALTEGRADNRRLWVRIHRHGEDRVRISLTDNGIGIARENLTNIFSHGFTTKETGHGFGLHSCANAAKEMGGMLMVTSDGLGKGATFTIELPYQPAEVLV